MVGKEEWRRVAYGGHACGKARSACPGVELFQVQRKGGPALRGDGLCFRHRTKLSHRHRPTRLSVFRVDRQSLRIAIERAGGAAARILRVAELQMRFGMPGI